MQSKSRKAAQLIGFLGSDPFAFALAEENDEKLFDFENHRDVSSDELQNVNHTTTSPNQIAFNNECFLGCQLNIEANFDLRPLLRACELSYLCSEEKSSSLHISRWAQSRQVFVFPSMPPSRSGIVALDVLKTALSGNELWTLPQSEMSDLKSVIRRKKLQWQTAFYSALEMLMSGDMESFYLVNESKTNDNDFSTTSHRAYGSKSIVSANFYRCNVEGYDDQHAESISAPEDIDGAPRQQIACTIIGASQIVWDRLLKLKCDPVEILDEIDVNLVRMKAAGRVSSAGVFEHTSLGRTIVLYGDVATQLAADVIAEMEFQTMAASKISAEVPRIVSPWPFAGASLQGMEPVSFKCADKFLLLEKLSATISADGVTNQMSSLSTGKYHELQFSGFFTMRALPQLIELLQAMAVAPRVDQFSSEGPVHKKRRDSSVFNSSEVLQSRFLDSRCRSSARRAADVRAGAAPLVAGPNELLARRVADTAAQTTYKAPMVFAKTKADTYSLDSSSRRDAFQDAASVERNGASEIPLNLDSLDGGDGDLTAAEWLQQRRVRPNPYFLIRIEPCARTEDFAYNGAAAHAAAVSAGARFNQTTPIIGQRPISEIRWRATDDDPTQSAYRSQNIDSRFVGLQNRATSAAASSASSSSSSSAASSSRHRNARSAHGEDAEKGPKLLSVRPDDPADPLSGKEAGPAGGSSSGPAQAEPRDSCLLILRKLPRAFLSPIRQQIEAARASRDTEATILEPLKPYSQFADRRKN